MGDASIGVVACDECFEVASQEANVTTEPDVGQAPLAHGGIDPRGPHGKELGGLDCVEEGLVEPGRWLGVVVHLARSCLLVQRPSPPTPSRLAPCSQCLSDPPA